jgi:2-methylcitrate dehydratase PrpD
MFLGQGKEIQLQKPPRKNPSTRNSILNAPAPYPIIIRRVHRSIDEQRRVIWLRFGSLDAMEKQWHTATQVKEMTDGLGQRWEIAKNTYKPYPCGVVLNPVIEACLELHKEPGLDVKAIERIEITGHPLLRERTDRPPPQSGREAQVSARHAVAVSLVRGKAGLDEFSDACVAEAGLRPIGDKLKFLDDASYSVESASIALRMDGGTTYSHHIKAARGGLGNPQASSF